VPNFARNPNFSYRVIVAAKWSNLTITNAALP
jgi:hypothetical protein